MPDYKIRLRGEIWIIDLKGKTMWKENEPNVVKYLDPDQLDHFRGIIITLYGYSALIKEIKAF